MPGIQVHPITGGQAFRITPTISAATYNTGTQLGGVMNLTNMIRTDPQVTWGTSLLVSIVIIGKVATIPPMDLWFFNELPTLLSTNNTALNIAGSEVAAKCLGVVSVGNSVSSNTSSSVSTDGGGIIKLMQTASSATKPSSLYMVAQIRGTGIFTSTSDITFVVGCNID